MSSEILPVIQRTDEDLVQLALELYSRSLTYVSSKQLHDAAFEAIRELKRRLGQRDAALKLADGWVSTSGFQTAKTCAEELRAIFATKDGK